MTIAIPYFDESESNNGYKAFFREVETTIRKDNNILLIGNGFDLALGKKTSYKDFIVYLFILYLVKFITVTKKTSFEVSPLLAAIETDLLRENNDDLIKIFDIAKNRLLNVSLDEICHSSDYDISFLDLLLKVIFQEKQIYFSPGPIDLIDSINSKIRSTVCFDYWLYVISKELKTTYNILKSTYDLLKTSKVISDCLRTFLTNLMKPHPKANCTVG